MDPRIAESAQCLARGEVVAFPTESTYGLGVDALSSHALERLFALKGRPEGKPPPILISDETMLELLVARVPPRARALMQRFWPGPLTLVLPARTELPAPLVSDGGVGVRRSPHPIADALVAAFGRPVTATSANLSGQPPAVTAAEARAAFPSIHVLDGGAAPGAAPSTVARVGDDGSVTILRAGALDPALLQE